MATKAEQTENEGRLDALEGSPTIKRLAVAIATANGHSDPEGWAERMVEAWENPRGRVKAAKNQE